MKQTQITCLFPVLIASLICIATGCGSTTVCHSAAETSDLSLPQSSPELNETQEDFYEIYKPYHLRFDSETQKLYFHGELVRCFWDGAHLEDGVSISRCNYFNEDGVVDIHTLREAVDNGDGSVNPFGILTGIEKSSQKEFEERDLSEFYRSDMLEATTCESSHFFQLSDLFSQQKSFSDIFKKYKALGILYVEAKDRSGAGNVYYNGQPVNAFIDESENGGVFSFHSADGGVINVRTIYNEEGNLTGIQTME